MLAAYQNEDMTVWKEYLDNLNSEAQTTSNSEALNYLYGYCGYIVAEAKKTEDEALMTQAKHYVALFKSQITNHQSQLPAGHYEMYLSAVYVYELRLHESIHPVKAMSLAKQATKLAPNDPIVLAYYGTCLYYAPAPFGSKKDALTWFERADQLFNKPEYQFCWVRLATNMYIRLCR